MRVTGRNIMFEGQFLRIVEKNVHTSNEKDRVWETVERRNVWGNGAVVVIPMTTDRELIFEKNWRVPLESWVIQFPAGLTDVESESEEETAKRELLEETGYLARDLIPVFRSPLSAALTNTRAMHFFAPDVEFLGKAVNQDIEQIEVLKVPEDKVDEFMLCLPERVELDLQVPGILWVMRHRGLL